jgi:hypothetical protein
MKSFFLAEHHKGLQKNERVLATDFRTLVTVGGLVGKTDGRKLQTVFACTKMVINL